MPRSRRSARRLARVESFRTFGFRFAMIEVAAMEFEAGHAK
ncbi:hypothetical protein OG746_26410 [Streptomyces sp. NBC_01016]|nr:hypothetical protein [Streptomyces sp. NBC_01016]MCX4832277.1 hypothetical protein [Streptomyces sp. NBC_01016]